jgi:N-acetylneuraminic acid mutarotase
LNAGIADIEWRLGPNLPEFRKGGCCAPLRGRVISAFGMRYPWGEMDTMYVYDPRIEWWARGPSAPIGQCYVQGTVCGGAYYSVGGRSGGVHERCFRLQAQGGRYVWSEIATLNEARAWSACASVGTRIYVFGGAKDAHGPAVGGVEMLDTVAPQGAWERIADIPGASRGWLAAATVRGSILVVGGSHCAAVGARPAQQGGQLDELLVFDPETSGWQRKSPLPYRLSGMDCSVYKDRYLIVVGGASEPADYTREMREQLSRVESHEAYYCPFVLSYDVEMDRWTRLPGLLPMPTNDIRVALIGQRLYAIGGENIEPATSNTTAWLRVGEIIHAGTQ